MSETISDMKVLARRSRACLHCPTPCNPKPNISKADSVCPADRWKPRPDAPAVPIGLGDAIERIVKPLAKALKLPCLEASGGLKPESPCAKRRDALNKITLPHA